LFESFPELPRKWLERKIESVFVLKNFGFTSWEQRPYLFKFPHNRPVTGGVDCMRQNCTFLPIKNDAGEVTHVCVTLIDVTDSSIYQSMMQEAVERLNEASNRDGLTGIFNRRYLEQALNKEFCRVKRYEGTLSFILLDLDHFKRVNDDIGHLAGDEVLRRTSEILSTCIRESDTLGRYGGEEFAVILPQTSLEGAATLAERLRQCVAAKPITFGDTSIPVSISVGVSELVDETSTYEELIQEADTALYQSKENGRNQVTCFDRQKTPG
jgi:diguanylate cyclase (GGDEF)-like protein